LRHIRRFNDIPTNEAIMLGGGDYEEVPDAESMTRGKKLMVEPLTPMDAKVLFGSIAEAGQTAQSIRMSYKNKRSDATYPAWYYQASGFMVAIALSKLLDAHRFLAHGSRELDQDDIGWAIEVAGEKEVLFTAVQGYLGRNAWLQVTKDEEEWFHVKFSSSRVRYFRCDQRSGLRDLIRDLPVLLSHEK